MNYPLTLATVVALMLPSAAFAAQGGCTTEDFEAYVLSPGGAATLGVNVLDENTIVNSQGPGLVVDGCVYDGLFGYLQWNDAGYYGRLSKDILSNGGDLELQYDSPVNSVDFTLDAYTGFPDTATCHAYDGSGNLLGSVGPLTLAGGVPVPVSFSYPGIAKILIDGGNSYSWGALLNDHVFCAGPSLSVSAGAPGGSMTFAMAGFTPSGLIGVVYGPAGAFVAPGGPCAGLALGLLPLNATAPILVGADANGAAQITQNVPGAASGISVQAADVIPGACVASNAIVL